MISRTKELERQWLAGQTAALWSPGPMRGKFRRHLHLAREQLREPIDLHPRHIRTAIDFAAGHRSVIDAEVTANDAAAEVAREAAERRADLMAS